MKHTISVTCAGIFTPAEGPPFLALRTDAGHVFEMPVPPDLAADGVVLGAKMELTLTDAPPVTREAILDMLSERYPEQVSTRELHDALSNGGPRARLYNMLYRLEDAGAVVKARIQAARRRQRGWTYVPECER